MRSRTTVKTIKTICGKTITYMQTDDQVAKIHSTEGPALVYSEEEKLAPEYYLFGIKYSKNEWKSLISQHKAIPVADAMSFDNQY